MPIKNLLFISPLGSSFFFSRSDYARIHLVRVLYLSNIPCEKDFILKVLMTRSLKSSISLSIFIRFIPLLQGYSIFIAKVLQIIIPKSQTINAYKLTAEQKEKKCFQFVSKCKGNIFISWTFCPSYFMTSKLFILTLMCYIRVT